jgi:hypothetical protein
MFQFIKTKRKLAFQGQGVLNCPLEQANSNVNGTFSISK